ncbi:MAG TPA: enoyl-CoA hydratase [Phycisphaerales bacterium]|nr:enoyl-CoA hydratase [Phycisphaerales bacterium]
MSELATLDIQGPIARLTLNRADKRNALSQELLDALHARVDELARAPGAGVTVCVVKGAGPTFCAGMDLKAVLMEAGAPLRLLSSIAELTIKLRRLAPVTVARVNGAAIGGGCGLVGVCDISVTHPEAKLGYPEVDLGVCPAVVAPWLVLAVGAGRARRILLQGGTMTGLRAHELGLVAHVVPIERLDSEVEAIVERIARAGGAALRATKALLNELDGPDLEAMVRRGARLSAEVIDGPEARERLGRLFSS